MADAYSVARSFDSVAHAIIERNKEMLVCDTTERSAVKSFVSLLVKRAPALSALEDGDPLPVDFVEELKQLVGFRRYRHLPADSLLDILIPELRNALQG
jgi:hypothetical protein